MPLFECRQCHCVENSALSNFAVRFYLKKLPPLCSECDPDIGQWHGKFHKLTLEEYQRRFPNAPRVEFPATARPPVLKR